MIDNVIRAASSIRHHLSLTVSRAVSDGYASDSTFPLFPSYTINEVMRPGLMPETFVLERGDAVSPSPRLSSFAVYTPSYARADGSVSTTHATEPLARVSEFHF